MRFQISFTGQTLRPVRCFCPPQSPLCLSCSVSKLAAQFADDPLLGDLQGFGRQAPIRRRVAVEPIIAREGV
jgi:hypothetical protein